MMFGVTGDSVVYRMNNTRKYVVSDMYAKEMQRIDWGRTSLQFSSINMKGRYSYSIVKEINRYTEITVWRIELRDFPHFIRIGEKQPILTTRGWVEPSNIKSDDTAIINMNDIFFHATISRAYEDGVSDVYHFFTSEEETNNIIINGFILLTNIWKETPPKIHPYKVYNIKWMLTGKKHPFHYTERGAHRPKKITTKRWTDWTKICRYCYEHIDNKSEHTVADIFDGKEVMFCNRKHRTQYINTSRMKRWRWKKSWSP